MVGMDLPKLVGNHKKACFLGKQHSLEATCSALSFISRYPATRRHRTERYKIHSNRTPTAHKLAHQRSEFMTSQNIPMLVNVEHCGGEPEQADTGILGCSAALRSRLRSCSLSSLACLASGCSAALRSWVRWRSIARLVCLAAGCSAALRSCSQNCIRSFNLNIRYMVVPDIHTYIHTRLAMQSR